MRIILKNKETLSYDDFEFKCSIGKKGTTSKKIEGDKKTPKGVYSLGDLFYRKDRVENPITKLKKKEIRKFMGWCDEINRKNYNKLIKINKNNKCEKLYRSQENYDLLIPINYNTLKIKKNKGSAIFLHICKDDFSCTEGCVAIEKKVLLELSKKINSQSSMIIEA